MTLTGIDREGILEDVIPYVSDPDRIKRSLYEALQRDDPSEFVRNLISAAEGPIRADLRILLNRMEKKTV